MNLYKFPLVPEEPFQKPCSVMRPWTYNLSFRQQTVLMVALRGFDGVGKKDPSKPLIKSLRMTLLQNAAPQTSSFMEFELTWAEVDMFFENCHHYPMHWLMHFAHAAEIIGYKHFDEKQRHWWLSVYEKVIEVLHASPESEEAMDLRLKDEV